MINSIDFCENGINIKAEAYISPDKSSFVCYLIGGESQVYTLLDEPKPNLIWISGFDWNRDLSPWKCGGVFGGEDFSGGGERFLSALTEIIPKCEAAFELAPEKRMIAGYSLAGLFSLWAAVKSDMFDRAVSMSGSLWFDRFTDFLRQSEPPKRLERIYISLGDRESSTRDNRMKTVGVNSEQCAEIFKERGIETRFEYNSGGHFKDVPARIAKGIDFICKP